jgi:hypothetical protein
MESRSALRWMHDTTRTAEWWGRFGGRVINCLLSKLQDGTAKQRDADSLVHSQVSLLMSFCFEKDTRLVLFPMSRDEEELTKASIGGQRRATERDDVIISH